MQVRKKVLLAASSLPAAFYGLGMGSLVTAAVISFKLIKSLMKVLKVIKHKLSYLDLEDAACIAYVIIIFLLLLR